jgi:hypothetical protein
MSSVPQLVLSAISHGQIYPPYDGVNDNFNSDKLQGNGYYGYTDGLHTVSYQLSGFVGRVRFQASLATDPTDTDWFDLDETVQGDGTNPVTGTFFHNFTGNFVWCRARVDLFSAGVISRVLYNT